jgi:hypothetical protein
MTGHWRWPELKLSAEEFRGAVSQLARPYLRDLVEVVYRWHMQAWKREMNARETFVAEAFMGSRLMRGSRPSL